MKTLRRFTQIIFFLFFVYLFLAASYPLTSAIPVDLFLRMDPLLALSSIISSRTFISTFIWAFVLLLATIPLGRFFCGWICPLGTALDLTSYTVKNKIGKRIKKLRPFKYYILFFLLVGALFSAQLIWFLDPIAIITRSLALSVFPIITLVFTSIFSGLFNLSFLQDFLLKIQSLLSSTLLPEQLTFFRFSGWILLIFAGIVTLEFVSRRFWCRNLCPLGALYALFSKYQILKRRVSADCTQCGQCQNICKMDAIPDDFTKTNDQECILCWDCVKDCPEAVTSIDFKSRESSEISSYTLDLSRRGFLASIFSGLLSVGILKTAFPDKNLKGKLIRPPGARPEPEFLDRCIRCHECVRVCSTSGRFLQPAFLEGGLEALWTPIGVARYGYCEYNCTMCTDVCPTEAIHKLDEETKKKTVIGIAFIDRDRCIPWYKNENCIVCEEQCPVPDKAIELREEKVIHQDGSERMVKRPYVKENLCIGCGICETKCPVEGKSAIFITPQNEQRWVD